MDRATRCTRPGLIPESVVFARCSEDVRVGNPIVARVWCTEYSTRISEATFLKRLEKEKDFMRALMHFLQFDLVI